MNEPVVYLNDGFVQLPRPISISTIWGSILGATLTEMTRTFRREPFRLRSTCGGFCGRVNTPVLSWHWTTRDWSNVPDLDRD